MSLPEPSIPHDLWSRLAWLDTQCDVQVSRRCAADGSGERVWRVSIDGRGRPDWPRITADVASLVDALRFAVLEAEHRGWHAHWPYAGRHEDPAARPALRTAPGRPEPVR